MEVAAPDASDTSNEQTVFPLNDAQNEGIMREVEKLAATARNTNATRQRRSRR
jgi:hypothetical protein